MCICAKKKTPPAYVAGSLNKWADIEGGGTVSAVIRVNFEGGGYVVNSLYELYGAPMPNKQAQALHIWHAFNAWLAHSRVVYAQILAQ